MFKVKPYQRSSSFLLDLSCWVRQVFIFGLIKNYLTLKLEVFFKLIHDQLLDFKVLASESILSSFALVSSSTNVVSSIKLLKFQSELKHQPFQQLISSFKVQVWLKVKLSFFSWLVSISLLLPPSLLYQVISDSSMLHHLSFLI